MSAPHSGSVVVAVDGKPGSAGALRYAVDQATRGDHSLHLVHVWPGNVPQDLVPVVAWAALQAEACAVLDRSAARAGDIAPGLEISTELAVGPPVAGVLAAGRGGRLMVVGRSPHHRVEAPGGGTPTALGHPSRVPGRRRAVDVEDTRAGLGARRRRDEVTHARARAAVPRVRHGTGC